LRSVSGAPLSDTAGLGVSKGHQGVRLLQRSGQSSWGVAALNYQLEGQKSTESGGSGLGEDLLLGAAAIAKELNWRDARGQWNVRRIYNLYSKGALPIHHVPGLGICARRSSLRNFFSALDDRVNVHVRTPRRNRVAHGKRQQA
jgi:hypothetical protein